MRTLECRERVFQKHSCFLRGNGATKSVALFIAALAEHLLASFGRIAIQGAANIPDSLSGRCTINPHACGVLNREGAA